MNGPRRQTAVLARWARLVALVVLPLSVSPASALDPPEPPDFRPGTHVFRRVLFDIQFEPLGRFEDLADNPRDTVLVVLGDTRCLLNVPGGLWNYVRAGGAVLVATDHAMDREARIELEALTGVRVTGEKLGCVEPGLRYRGLDYCPWVQPRIGITDAGVLFRQPQKEGSPFLLVATNAPSRLQIMGTPLPGDVRILATLPPGCYSVPFRGFVYRYPPLFAVGGSAGEGRVLFLADHSIFINEMMLPTDNGNVEFTYNCLTWLRGTDPPRHKVLFVEDGLIRQDFNIPLRNIPIPFDELMRHFWDHPNAALAGLGKELVRLEHEDKFNQVLFNTLDAKGLTPRVLAPYIAVVLTVAVALYLFARVASRSRHRVEPAVPLLVNALDPHRPDAPLIQQRQRALLLAGNLWEAAHELARQWFANHGLAPLVLGKGAGEPPEVLVPEGWRERLALRPRIARLWRLAHDPNPWPVSAGGLRDLLRELEELGAALANGSLRLAAKTEGPRRKPNAEGRAPKGPA
jgi:hypothetical protein